MLAPALAASPASAATTSEVKSLNNTHCIDELANSSHTVALTSCQKAANEEWTIAFVNSTDIRFQDASTGGCLAERPGTGIVITGCNPSSPEQQWDELVFESGSTISSVFENEAVSGACLNQTGFSTDVVTCNTASKSQHWQLIS